METVKHLVHSNDQMISMVRHALFTAAAVGLVAFLQSVSKMDFGSGTVIVDGVVALVLRALSTYIPATGE